MGTPRVRTKTDPPTTNQTDYIAWTGDVYPFFFTTTREQSMSDVVDKNFHARSSKGEVFNNGCIYQSVDVYIPPDQELCSWLQYPTGKPQEWATLTSGNHTAASLGRKPIYNMLVCDAQFPPTDVVTDSKQIALGKVDASPFGVGEDLAEIRETLRLLLNPLEGIAGLARAFQRKKNRIINSSINEESKLLAIAQAWATFRFGAEPLYRSVSDILEALAKKGENLRPKRRTAHGRSERSNSVVTYQDNASGISHKYHYVKNSIASVHGHAAIFYEHVNPLDDWRFRFGLRWKDLPVVAWEIVPLSFMVDRITDIKSMIAGLINLADPSITILSASSTLKTLKQHSLSCYDETWGYGELVCTIGKPDVVMFETFNYERTEWTPNVTDTIPIFDWRGLIADATKTADLLAVIVTRLL